MTVTATCPALEVDSDLPAPRLKLRLAVPAIEAESDLPANTFPPLTLTAAIPDANANLPVATPTFTIVVHRKDTTVTTATVEVQIVASGDSFDSPLMALSATAPLRQTVETTRFDVRALAPLDDGDYDWRVRTVLDAVPSPWHQFPWGATVNSFTVDTTSATANGSIGLQWDIGGDPAPHLWFVTPAAGAPGTQATLVGAGFGDTPGTVALAGVPATVISWTVEPASGATTDRRIDAGTGVADPEHSRVVVTIPTVPPPGGPFVVRTV